MKTGKHKNGADSGALALLRADHDKVKALFRAFDALRGSDGEERRKTELVDEICFELTLHTMLEEEIFYPALRAAIDDDELLDEADIEHAGARELIGQLEIMLPGDDHYDATVTVLGEEVAHHIAKEESELFEAARDAGIELDALGAQLATRKTELEEDLSSPPSTLDAMTPHDGARRQPRAPN
ncbi:MAG TPA: hemerythrin domain-containing protein [Telluria sp.]|nr:hemerythrin domain-containing protein [Telluria sp.]